MDGSRELALPELATRINQAHQQAEAAARSAIEHALRAGELLIEAKARCGHGEWAGWLEANFKGSERTAQAYMRVAKHQAELAKAQSSADLTVDQALKLLAAPRAGHDQGDHHSAFRKLRWPPAKMAEICAQWWDFQAAYVLLLDVAGDEPESIAASLGISIADVRKVLSPEIPDRSGESIFSAVPRLYAWYRRQVDGLIACQFTRAYSNAACHAEREGLDELKPALKAMDRQAWRNYRALTDETKLLGEIPDVDNRDMGDRLAMYIAQVFNGTGHLPGRRETDNVLWHTLFQCAVVDFRDALGIEETSSAFENVLEVTARLAMEPSEN